MTIRFAPAGYRRRDPVSCVLAVQSRRDAANDNSGVMGCGALGRDQLLRETLLHFARHGLAAAERARQEAERAFFAGDREDYRRWLEICRALDRRMAAALDARRAGNSRCPATPKAALTIR